MACLMIIYLAFHFLCMVLTYGVWLADFFSDPSILADYVESTRDRNLMAAFIMVISVYGPVSLGYAMAITGSKNGLRWTA